MMKKKQTKTSPQPSPKKRETPPRPSPKGRETSPQPSPKGRETSPRPSPKGRELFSDGSDNSVIQNSPSPLERGLGGEVDDLGLGNVVPTVPKYYKCDPETWAVLVKRARNNRKNPTKAEAALWEHLRNNKLNCRFRRQHPIDCYIPDFVCIEKKLIIEVDGGYHNDPCQIPLDEIREWDLMDLGFHIIRFTNEEVLNQITDVVEIIRKRIEETPPLPKEEGDPTPALPKGEGDLSPTLPKGEGVILRWK